MSNACYEQPVVWVFCLHANCEGIHHRSGLSSIAEVSFWRPLKTVISCDLFIIIIIIIFIINFFKRAFSECTEAITISLIPLESILPEEYAFIIGFSCTVWTKMRYLLAP